MTATLTAVALSVLSAIAYALSAVAQERFAARSRRPANPWALLRSARWWGSVSLNAGGAVLHIVALRYASLAVVQPLGALTLVLALPIGAAVTGRRVTGREWRGATATLTGLGGLLLAVDTGAPTEALDTPGIVALSVLTAAAITVLGRASNASARARGLRLATASGIAFGISSVLTQTVMLRLTDPASGAIPDATTAATAAAVAVLSVGGLLLSQAAYQTGLGAPLATLTIANPVTAAVVGFVLLRQNTALTPRATVVAVLATALAILGVLLLATPATPAMRRPCNTRRLPRRPAFHRSRRPRERRVPGRTTAPTPARRSRNP
ncbi:DMT family transporter [Micromonospora sp. NPDC049679]|uniref:DMT family transporter n=1 Tax=Micromonospora sp. NPDC049679 TaxID=3155920 RepID=UPI0033EBF47C